jgi:ribosomal protein L11 methylase PrmA
MKNNSNLPSSFRDPSGFLFWRDGTLFRHINKSYREDYRMLMDSGLYARLIKKNILIPHTEIDDHTIKPEIIPFISYPYEWCFSQLKEAALTTLAIQKEALATGMILKDASAFNIQFLHGKPVFIDTLSFERYREGEPWMGYRQFCQHFLAPLALMAYRDMRLNTLSRIFLDGVPLDLATRLLPWTSMLHPALLIHLHLHAKSHGYVISKPLEGRRMSAMNRATLLRLTEHLEAAIMRLAWKPKGTEWANYYEETNYSDQAMREKADFVARCLDKIAPKTVWDFGANTGFFSRLASGKNIMTISFDNDPAAVEKNYQEVRKNNEAYLLPLIIDLMNPSPALGWGNQERMTFLQRGPCDTALALALIHHLAISNNLPFESIAEFFASVCTSLIIEFVPKEDSNTRRLLVARKDIFFGYTRSAFEEAFEKYFTVKEIASLGDSQRLLYCMVKR